MSVSSKNMTLAVCTILLCAGILLVQSAESRFMQNLAKKMQNVPDRIAASSMEKGVLVQTNQQKIQYTPLSEWKMHTNGDGI